jgi:hypothetical protein
MSNVGNIESNITIELAVESLWQAFEWEPIKLTEIFDRIAFRLHRHPRFRDMSITEIDRLVTDVHREAEHDLSEYEWRLVRAFKDAIEFKDANAA